MSARTPVCTRCFQPWASSRYRTCDACRRPARQTRQPALPMPSSSFDPFLNSIQLPRQCQQSSPPVDFTPSRTSIQSAWMIILVTSGFGFLQPRICKPPPRLFHSGKIIQKTNSDARSNALGRITAQANSRTKSGRRLSRQLAFNMNSPLPIRLTGTAKLRNGRSALLRKWQLLCSYRPSYHHRFGNVQLKQLYICGSDC